MKRNQLNLIGLKSAAIRSQVKPLCTPTTFYSYFTTNYLFIWQFFRATVHGSSNYACIIYTTNDSRARFIVPDCSGYTPKSEYSMASQAKLKSSRSTLENISSISRIILLECLGSARLLIIVFQVNAILAANSNSENGELGTPARRGARRVSSMWQQLAGRARRMRRPSKPTIDQRPAAVSVSKTQKS